MTRPQEDKEVARFNQSASKALISRMREPYELAPAELDRRGIIRAGSDDVTEYNAFRELRTELLHQTEGRHFTAVVSSVVAGGGGTHVAVNLATSIAMDPEKTALVIDCNLRRPRLHRLFDLDPKPGLTDFLHDPKGIQISEIIRATGVPRLRVIPAGERRDNPETLASMNMRLLMHVLRERYDDRHIILDAPSMEAGADARILAEVCDMVLLVVPYGGATSSRVYDAARAFPHEKIAGAVFNRQPMVLGH